MESEDETVQFEGFDPVMNQRHFFPYPMVLASYWCDLSGSEQKCLDFILRQTIGWRKESDFISLDQFCGGVGNSMNFGTGLSKSQVRRAILGLEKKKFIYIERRKNRPSRFTLHISGQSEPLRKGASKTSIRNRGNYHQGLK